MEEQKLLIPQTIDLEQLHKWWNVFQNDGKRLCEVRLLTGENGTYSGYFRSLDNLKHGLALYENIPNLQMYFILNSISEACYDRKQREYFVKSPKNSTTDNDIIFRDWILIDFDPKRPSGVGSSDEELKAAKEVAQHVRDFLHQQGFSQPVIAKSGNGYHLLIPIAFKERYDERNDQEVIKRQVEENNKLIGRFLKAIDMLFSTDKVDIDTKVGNASRICKLYGTMARKGSNTQDRPWRVSKIIKVPDEIVPTSKEYVAKVASMYPEDAPTPSKENNFGREKFDVVKFLNEHNISYKEKVISEGVRYILEECPFNSEHKWESMVFQHKNGAMAFTCFHNSCSQYTWRDFRLHYDPQAYDKKDYNEYKQKVSYYSNRYVEPEPIKEENERDGKKWLCLKDIHTIKDENLIAINTGIYALDKAIKGLILGQLSVISGINASGKSVWLNSLALNAVEQQFPTAMFSGELPDYRMKMWLMQTAAGKANVTKVQGLENAYNVSDKVIGKIEDWLDNKLFIYNNKYGSKFDQLVSDVKDCIEHNGIKLVIIDNLMAINLESISGDKNEKQKSLIQRFSEMAKQYSVHIIIVAHPRKETGMTFLRKDSIAGTADITNLADNLFLVHRVSDDFEKRATDFWGKEKVQAIMAEGYGNVIEVAKNREYGINDRAIGTFFEPESRRFKNSRTEQIQYTWEEGYTRYEQVFDDLPEQTPNTIQPNTSFDTTPEPTPEQATEPTQTQSTQKDAVFENFFDTDSPVDQFYNQQNELSNNLLF